jgi:hypothetical protein
MRYPSPWAVRAVQRFGSEASAGCSQHLGGELAIAWLTTPIGGMAMVQRGTHAYRSQPEHGQTA